MFKYPKGQHARKKTHLTCALDKIIPTTSHHLSHDGHQFQTSTKCSHMIVGKQNGVTTKEDIVLLGGPDIFGFTACGSNEEPVTERGHWL